MTKRGIIALYVMKPGRGGSFLGSSRFMSEKYQKGKDKQLLIAILEILC